MQPRKWRWWPFFHVTNSGKLSFGMLEGHLGVGCLFNWVITYKNWWEINFPLDYYTIGVRINKIKKWILLSIHMDMDCVNQKSIFPCIHERNGLRWLNTNIFSWNIKYLEQHVLIKPSKSISVPLCCTRFVIYTNMGFNQAKGGRYRYDEEIRRMPYSLIRISPKF
jgi:hypothetical protein